MPKYYHIHRGLEKSNIENKFENGKLLFFSKKNSFWYNYEIEISKDYGGYIIYEIDISPKIFTYSFKPKRKNTILKINKSNMNKYLDIKRPDLIKLMKQNNIIGVDATTKLFNKKNFNQYNEAFIIKKTKHIKIKKHKY